ncbi:alpha-1,3-mannosyl-glycoprotein 2-beta-N-acetylglucosaminyltransferase [Pectinophora gossypiella]|uniref:alpha-1,3-mannosyl-glycoprotein 2-beta-N-acetylglucosaminyltransferase n=1 Tax=Pectinophora gossypiella TaxID=13191 RepID=UPI00214E8580|nr:alpha-1,3-mannosyl-glycoprotein 2-beta-N-acetylglucosaminyltransferase [Pectinophora gossypiella]
MRLNLKKVFAALAFVVFFWLIITYSPVMEVPRPMFRKGSNIGDIEKRILKLEKEIGTQSSEITRLLDTVKEIQKRKSTTKDEMYEIQVLERLKNEQGRLLPPPSNPVLPVLVIACDRVTVKRCLDNLIKFRPSKETFPIVVSQDCNHNATYQVIKQFTDADPSITVVRQPDQSEVVLPRQKIKFRGYYKIARHYRFALNHVFTTLKHESVIIVEDDLDISPDFFEYFLGTYPLLLNDPSIWCISAWNDNGKRDVIDLAHPELLHRTDFFPGLGWLLRRESWLELEPNWPPAFFDDWLRNPENTRGRACIRPEVSRTYSFGKVGVSKGLFFDLHLRHMQLNTQFVEFTKLNLTYLLKENYDEALTQAVAAAQKMSADEVMTSRAPAAGAVRVPYMDARSFQKAAKKLGLMDDFRSGIPRTAYFGIVTCFVRGRRVYLAPNFNWSQYDPSWQ